MRQGLPLPQKMHVASLAGLSLVEMPVECVAGEVQGWCARGVMDASRRAWCC
jgi:hypothetical protein